MELSAYYAFPEAHGAICLFTVDYYIDSPLSLENLDTKFFIGISSLILSFLKISSQMLDSFFDKEE